MSALHMAFCYFEEGRTDPPQLQGVTGINCDNGETVRRARNANST